MDATRTTAVLFLMLIAGAAGSTAQTHFTFTSNTGSNAVVAVPGNINPNIAGVPLEHGDEIGAFSPAGLCVGACVWEGAAASISVWGDNTITPETDGMMSGETIKYRIWDSSAAIEYPIVNVTYATGDGIYQPNGIYALSSISATGELPVELTTFSAARSGRGVILAWATATEVSNYGFEVERSAAGGKQWQKIGFVEGSGTTNTPHEYSYSDRTASGESYSYRLKQIDRDGKFSYSQTVDAPVNNLPSEFRLYQNFPNPFNPSTVIGFDIPRDAYTRLVVYDMLGRRVAELADGMMAAGHYTAVFNASQLSGGIYLYRLEAGTDTQVRPMLLVK
jgi:hypothetical protein